MMSESYSIGTPAGGARTSCGYCSEPGQPRRPNSSYHSAGFQALQLSCEVYQKMIDRGWRRSGTWCYKPDLRASCCPQYTIKLDALHFKPSKSQRKLINRWNRFIQHGRTDTDRGTSKAPPAKNTSEFSFIPSIHLSEYSGNDGTEHRFEVTLEPSSYTSEKFSLFEKYQTDIHHDADNSPGGFKRFLVDSPLKPEPIPYISTPPAYLPKLFGSYHQLYRVDGQLMAMAVLDILPNCVSSVYFMYDKAWEEHSLGKLSALREVALAQEIRAAGVQDMSALYMGMIFLLSFWAKPEPSKLFKGFYIHSCQKMRYKGDYAPSYLADPETYEWYPLEVCRLALDTYRYACFSDPGHSVNEIDSEPSAVESPIADEELKAINLIDRVGRSRVRVTSLAESPFWAYEDIRNEMSPCLKGMGMEVAKKVFFDITGSFTNT